jgi:hypothetical protein
MWSASIISVKCSGMPTGDITSSAAPVSEKLRTVQSMAPPPNEILPGRDDQEARGVVDDILLSLLLGVALRRSIPRWFYSGAAVLVRLNRKEIGDDDAKIIANILISQFKGQTVIEDFGFYAREHLSALIRQERLIAGVYTLSELPEKLRDRAMLMPKAARDAPLRTPLNWRNMRVLRPDPPEKRTRTIGSVTKRWRPDCNYHPRALLVLHEQSSIKFFAAGTCQV